jgi:ribosome-associated toxin RatA of RatAB toxin-antitoxin module
MQTVSARRLIPVGAGILWPLISDVTQIAHWHFNIATVDLLSGRQTGVGAARRCNFHDGSSVREDVVAVEDGRKVRMELSEYSVPMKHLELEIALREQSKGVTEAILTLRYVMKFGVIGKIMGATAVRKQLTGVATKLLAGLEHHANTGEVVGKGFFAKAA